MPSRSEKYPLDVSLRYPESGLSGAPYVRARDRVSGLTVHPDTDDLTNELLYRLVRSAWVGIHKTLAYCDVIDLAQEATAKDTDTRLSAVVSEVGALRTSIDTLISFFGVIVPGWSTKDEIENGDEMGIVHKSAAELGIVVTYGFAQQESGYGHEEVIAIDPPAGSLVVRGSQVRVTLNLEG